MERNTDSTYCEAIEHTGQSTKIDNLTPADLENPSTHIVNGKRITFGFKKGALFAEATPQLFVIIEEVKP